MITIHQKRVLNVAKYLPEQFVGRSIVIGVLQSQVTREQLSRIGLNEPLNVGEKILPSIIGPITRFNAQGKEIPQRNKPKETHYRDMEFTRHEWHGKDRVEVTGCVWIPYRKYPRKIISPPSIELNVTQSTDGKISISAPSLKYTASNHSEIEHSINLILEIFGVCNVYLHGETPLVIPITKRLNWKLLPPGNMPWDRLKQSILASRSQQAPKAYAAALERFEKINALGPDFRATGQGGYQGYVVFGFSQKNIFILESQQVNNAIYILGNDWNTISQQTKAEIIANNKCIARIIHTPKWYEELVKYVE
jgi:hypothetical protein